MASRAKELFLDLLELDATARTAYLDSACNGDEDLRRDVEALLDAHEGSSTLDGLVGAPVPEQPELPLALVGDYELLEVLGRGAAGTVYLARQSSLGREVALKVLRAGSLASDNDVRRFRREAEAAAGLDHPNIVPVYDIGEVDEHYFFSMKHIDGSSLDERVADYTDDPREAAGLVATVARAVDHAHRRGVLHRDLKPSNILLDRSGVPYVADFGVALTLDQTRITQTGLIFGTPAYMSPEQARAHGDVTLATDVWSLGCVLHELLTGEPPFAGGGVADVLRRVVEEEPAAPEGVDRDLATIVGACLAKDPSRRYASAEALADDLERWLEHLPIQARPATLLERVRLMCRRSPVAFALSIAIGILLTLIVSGALATSVMLGERLKDARSSLRRSLIANARAERLSNSAGRRAASLSFLSQAADIEVGADIRDEAITTLTLPDLVARSSWTFGKSGDPLPIAVDGALETLALVNADGAVEIRSCADGRLLSVLSNERVARRKTIFTRRGERLWLLIDPSSEGPAELEVWDVVADPPERLFQREVRVETISTPAGDSLVALVHYPDPVVELVDEDTFEVVRRLEFETLPQHCSFRPQGGLVAIAFGTEDKVEIRASPDGELITTLELDEAVYDTAWSEAGDVLLVGCFDQRAYMYETSTWERIATLTGHEGEIVDVAMLPGLHALTTAWDGTTRFWDIGGKELFRSTAYFVAWDREGHRALMHRDTELEVADLVLGETLNVLRAHEGKAPREVDFDPGGRFAATCGDTDWILWDSSTGARAATVPAQAVESVFFDANGRVVTTGDAGILRYTLSDGADGSVAVGDPEVLHTDRSGRGGIDRRTGRIAFVRFEPGPRAGVLREPDGTLRELGTNHRLDRVTLSPGGEWVAIGTWGGDGMRIWKADTAELVAHLFTDEPSTMATFSPEGAEVAIASDLHVRFLEVGTWRVLREVEREGPRRPSAPVAYTADGERLAMLIAPGRLRLERRADEATLLDLVPYEPYSVFHLRFSPDGSRLGVATTGQRFLLWNLARLDEELGNHGL